MKKNISLVIDFVAQKGSLSLFENEVFVAATICKNEDSTSKVLLKYIAELLENNSFELKDLSEIVYTRGPGSFTNLRVGISSVLALRRVLKIPIYPISIMETYSSLIETENIFTIITAITKNKFALQSFARVNSINSPTCKISFLSFNSLLKAIKKSENRIYTTIDVRKNVNRHFETSNSLLYELDSLENTSLICYQAFLKNRNKYVDKIDTQYHQDLMPIYEN